MEHKTSDDASVLDIMHFSIDGKYIARMSQLSTCLTATATTCLWLQTMASDHTAVICYDDNVDCRDGGMKNFEDVDEIMGMWWEWHNLFYCITLSSI